MIFVSRIWLIMELYSSGAVSLAFGNTRILSVGNPDRILRRKFSQPYCIAISTILWNFSHSTPQFVISDGDSSDKSSQGRSKLQIINLNMGICSQQLKFALGTHDKFHLYESLVQRIHETK